MRNGTPTLDATAQSGRVARRRTTEVRLAWTALWVLLLAPAAAGAAKQPAQPAPPARPEPPAQLAPPAPAPPPPTAAAPTPAALLSSYDAVMGPSNFEARTRMIAHRDDGSTRDYTMKVLKKGDERFRIWFEAPSSVAGQEMLRVGDNLWVYMPNLKRAVRLANRDSFQGGDFNNADVLRVNYRADYDAVVTAECATAEAWCLDLTAKTKNASYDKVRLWLRKSDQQPLKGEYFGASGRVLRRAEFSEHRAFEGLVRPGKIIMRNMINVQRYSVMAWETMSTRVDPPSTRFVVTDLGK